MGTERVRKQSCGCLEQNATRKNDSHQERRGEMLIAIVLDKPLSEAQALVDNPDAFMLEITVEVPLSQPCFEHFFRPCFRGHDEAGLLAFEALRGSPRPARGHGRKT